MNSRHAGLSLEPGTVDVWTATLPLSPYELGVCEAVLSIEERARADGRPRPADRLGFIAVRGVLRRLLALYCGCSAESLRFQYGPTGKPGLLGAPQEMGIGFNVSHAGQLAVLAFSKGVEVGVDVERIRPVARAQRIAERVMPEDRFRHWRKLGQDAQIAGFIREWTRLEAFSKLTGEGVWKTLLAGRHRGEEGASWFALDPVPGYIGALAVGAPSVRLRLHRWPPVEEVPGREF